MDKESGVIQRTSAVLADLIGNVVHDRHTLSTRFGISLAAADRYIRQLQQVPGVVQERQGRRLLVRFDFGRAVPRPSYPAAVAACWAAGLAEVFVGSDYEQGVREALAYVTGRAKRSAEFKAVERKFVFLARGGESSLPDSAERLDELVDAVLRSRYAIIDYVEFKGEEKTVRIQPLSLVIYDHQIYVIGVRPDGERRLYRLSRIRSVDVGQDTFEYPDRANYDPKELFRDSFGIFMGGEEPTVRVRVRLDKEWRVHAQTHRWHPSQSVEEVEEGIVVTLTARVCWELKAWILSFGHQATVLEPPELVEQIRGTVADMARNYGVSVEQLKQRKGPQKAQGIARGRRVRGRTA
jgi:predicted DNA-binding transcriptional regulator YafY